MSTIADELSKLKQLLDDGVLTQDEFNIQKKNLLAQSKAEPSFLPAPPQYQDNRRENDYEYSVTSYRPVKRRKHMFLSVLLAIIIFCVVFSMNTMWRRNKAAITTDIVGTRSSITTTANASSSLMTTTTTPAVNIVVQPKAPEEIAKIFSDHFVDKDITIENVEQELSDFLLTEAEGEFHIEESSNYEGQYLATFDIVDISKGAYSLTEAKELARNIMYYISAVREKYDLPFVYVSMKIMENDAMQQYLIVTGLGSDHLAAAPEGAWSDKPMETADFIKYVQDNYDQAISGIGKSEHIHRAFYMGGGWQPPPKPDLELLGYEGTRNDFGIDISGTIKNNTSKGYSYVQVEIGLYDDSGAKVGTAMDNITNLDPYGTWKFEAHGWTDNATKYSIEDISGW